ncbi:hypothetical protein [Chryseobacterium populi]|uniref:hypothetical protein n=1 Tax=Chryseobacterium populi TaxID=1144316 RepID=UPI0002EBA90A
MRNHFGDKSDLLKEVSENAERTMISFGDKETSNLAIAPEFFTLGDNDNTFNIKYAGHRKKLVENL